MKKGYGSLEVFMTANDEKKFSELIRFKFPEILFIDGYPWEKAILENNLKKTLDECHTKLNSLGVIYHPSIFPIEEYKAWIRKVVPNREEYDPPRTGRGLIQLSHSKEAGYTPGGLRNATLIYSFDIETDKETEKFVKEVFKICKKNAHKLYVLDPQTGAVSEKPHSRFFAWPDAVNKYDQVNGMYLTNNTMAYFTTKK